MKWTVRAMAVVLTLVCSVVYASATQYTFSRITNNNSADAGIGEAQFLMDVTKEDSVVYFKFTNTGPNASSITDIYFEDKVPLLIYKSFIESAGVDYTEGATPSKLPGGQSYYFVSNYSYDSDTPIMASGINPGEDLTIVFLITSGYSFSDILDALENASMRVGLHVQAFASGASEGYINDPPSDPPAVPEPGTMVLLGAGMLGLAIFGKRRMNRD